MKLVDKIEYYMQHAGERESLNALVEKKEIGKEELDLLDAIYGIQQYRAAHPLDVHPDQMDETEILVIRMEAEKEIFLALKDKVLSRIDKLLSQEDLTAWMEILTWYRLLEVNGLIARFWELYLLKIILDIFLAELKQAQEKGTPISVLKLHSIKEMEEAYLKAIFLLRRIEYNIEPTENIRARVMDAGYSYLFLKNTFEHAQIINQKKVNNIVNEWFENT